MTDADGPGWILVWDASPLHHAIKADRIDVLADIARLHDGCPRRNVTTVTVIDELQRHALPVSGLGWLDVELVDGLPELTALIRWTERVSASDHNLGEATVLAWAEVHGAAAVIDDMDARRAARNAGMAVYGSLRLVANAVAAGRITAYAADRFVESLAASGARYPCQPSRFSEWAKENGLLP